MILVGYENLEPSDWFVSLVRTKGILLVTAGILALLIEGLSAKMVEKTPADDATDSSTAEDEE